MTKSVVVMGRKIPIKIISQDEMNKFIPHAIGMWDSGTRTIYLVKESKAEMLCTLAHEIGHALFTMVGIDQCLAPEMQEIIVQSYATLIEDILKKRTVL